MSESPLYFRLRKISVFGSKISESELRMSWDSLFSISVRDGTGEVEKNLSWIFGCINIKIQKFIKNFLFVLHFFLFTSPFFSDRSVFLAVSCKLDWNFIILKPALAKEECLLILPFNSIFLTSSCTLKSLYFELQNKW